MTLKGIEFLSYLAPLKTRVILSSKVGQSSWIAIRILTFLYPISRQYINSKDVVKFTSRAWKLKEFPWWLRGKESACSSEVEMRV